MLRALALPEDPALHLRITCNCIARGSDALFWASQTPGTRMQTTLTCVKVYRKKDRKNDLKPPASLKCSQVWGTPVSLSSPLWSPTKTALVPKSTHSSWPSGHKASQNDTRASKSAKQRYTPKVRTVSDPVSCLPP